MNPLLPAQIAQFMKRFRFQRGALRRFQIRNLSRNQSFGEILLTVHEVSTDKRIRLRMTFDDVAEYRFQRRPGPGLIRLKDVRMGVFDGVIFLNLDAFADEPSPGIHEFRASDAFIAGRSVAWEIVPPKTNSKHLTEIHP